MGRLSGFKYREVARRLRAFGWSYDRPSPGRHVTLPHHARDMAEGTLRAVLREAGIDVEAFLNA